jgi:glycosyltransferase involved in cell wall biosynthesis
VPDAPLVTVVIPTRDRAASLTRTLDALRRQDVAVPWEIVIVDDGSEPPLEATLLDRLPDARLLRRGGDGPARARNAGIAAARGRYVAFTDDDTEPAPTWLSAAVAHLEAHPEHAAVEGRVDSSPFDPLRAVSLVNHAPGAYWTCNIAYRKDVLDRVGGFDEGFPNPHCEDLDLAFRVLRETPIGYADAMAIVHHARPMGFGELTRRARLTVSEIRLFERHRERYGRASRLPAPLFPIAQSAGFWRYMLSAAGRDPARIARALATAAVYSVRVAAAVARARPWRAAHP